MNPVTRTKSEKQALVAFVTMTRALVGVSFSSGRGRCSNQYHPPTSAAATTTPNAGLRYSESIIAGSIQVRQEDMGSRPSCMDVYGRPPLGKDFLAFRQTNPERSCIRPL